MGFNDFIVFLGEKVVKENFSIMAGSMCIEFRFDELSSRYLSKGKLSNMRIQHSNLLLGEVGFKQ